MCAVALLITYMSYKIQCLFKLHGKKKCSSVHDIFPSIVPSFFITCKNEAPTAQRTQPFANMKTNRLTFHVFYNGYHYLFPSSIGLKVKGVGLLPLYFWHCGFESHRGHGGLYRVLSGRSLWVGLITSAEES